MEIVKYNGDSPFPRFGHTLSQISKSKILLFGGATGNTGKYSINSDVFIFEIPSRKWRKLNPSGPIPTQRAAHATVYVEPGQIYIYGGATGGGGLSSDDLLLLDIRNGEDKAIWMSSQIIGVTPGRRYGHSLVYYKPFVIVFGGNTGNEPVNDVWALNLEKFPMMWNKIDTKHECPPVRVYHSAAVCNVGSAAGMMVIFGGRTSDGSALNDTWGFRRHRDGRWDWVKAPYKNIGAKPLARYQHTSLFLNSLFLVIGGRTNNTADNIPLEIYDTQTSDWFKFGNFPRFRHASWITDQWLFLFGGFDQRNPNIPTDELLRINLVKLFQKTTNILKISNLDEVPDTFIEQQDVLKNSMVTNMSQNIMQQSLLKRSSNNIQNTSFLKTSSQKQSTTPIKNIRLASQAIIATSYGPEDDGNRLLRRLSIDKLQEESKKLGLGFKDQSQNSTPAYIERLYNWFISQLLIPREFSYDIRFNLKREMVAKLCDEVEKILEDEPVLIHLKAPLKIYGNLNGQMGDLMKLFEHFGMPCDSQLQGDIEGFTYLFLGDYVDLGRYSVEVICLLLSLKLKYPDGIYLLRGHHEDRAINRMFGLGEECARKFNEDIDEKDSIFFRLNRIFDLLPLAAVIEEKILCVHGGIGTTLNNISEIENMDKPIVITPNTNNYTKDQIVLDLLYSDPVENELENNNKPNPDRNFLYTNIKKFGIDRLRSFIKENNLNFIIRSHECCKDGFERFSNDSLMTVFSAMDYCGKGGNAASVLIVKKNLEVIPKIVYPNENNLGFGFNRWEGFGENINDDLNNYAVKFNKDEMTMKKKKNVTPLRF